MQNKDISLLRKQLKDCETKLSNPDFLKKAPENIVVKELRRMNDLIAELQSVIIQIKSKKVNTLGSFMVKDTVFNVKKVV